MHQRPKKNWNIIKYKENYLRDKIMKMKTIRTILSAAIICLFLLSSCAKKQGYVGALIPNKIELPAKGTYTVVQASQDGCSTAASSRGNSMYRTFYKYRKDPYFTSNSVYYDSWFRAYIYCFHIINY